MRSGDSGAAIDLRRGFVRSLEGGAKASFARHIGYVDSSWAAAAAQSIEGARQ
jgi:hypothetical protein